MINNSCVYNLFECLQPVSKHTIKHMEEAGAKHKGWPNHNLGGMVQIFANEMFVFFFGDPPNNFYFFAKIAQRFFFRFAPRPQMINGRPLSIDKGAK